MSHGKLFAVGVSFSDDALRGLPTVLPAGEEGIEYTLSLPKEAAGSVFKQIGINWNPHGHAPSKIYDVGHFDFHFYMIPENERNTITAAGEGLKKAYIPLPDDLTPSGYILAPDSAMPRMGAHWADPNSHEFHGHAFTKTFLFGSYDGKLLFFEPMITKAYLETKPNVTEAIKLPARFVGSNDYPTRYTVTYDAGTKEYTVALEGISRS